MCSTESTYQHKSFLQARPASTPTCVPVFSAFSFSDTSGEMLKQVLSKRPISLLIATKLTLLNSQSDWHLQAPRKTPRPFLWKPRKYVWYVEWRVIHTRLQKWHYTHPSWRSPSMQTTRHPTSQKFWATLQSQCPFTTIDPLVRSIPLLVHYFKYSSFWGQMILTHADFYTVGKSVGVDCTSCLTYLFQRCISFL